MTTTYQAQIVSEPSTKSNLPAIQALAESGDIGAQEALGIKLVLQENYKEAAYWIGKAASQGSGNAQFILAFLYGYGHGVRKNKKAAEQWFVEGVKNTHDSLTRMRRCEFLGKLFMCDVVLKQNFKKALRYLDIALMLGSPTAGGLLKEVVTELTRPRKQSRERETALVAGIGAA